MFGTPEERADTAAALKSATGIIRSEVGRLIGLRHTPSLEFIADELPENAQRIDDLVAAARQKDEELARASEGAQWAGDPDPYKKPAEDGTTGTRTTRTPDPVPGTAAAMPTVRPRGSPAWSSSTSQAA